MDFNDSGCFKTLKSDECKYQKYVASKQIAANYRIILGPVSVLSFLMKNY